MRDRITAVLTGLGHTTSEARCYIALLRQHPASAAQAAKVARLPVSAARTILRRLEATQLVRRVGSAPERYEPLPTDELVALLKQRPAPEFREYRETLAALEVSAGDGELHNVTGYEALLAAAEELINGAQESLAISLWCREANHLAHHIRAATARGVHGVFFSFCQLPDLGGHTFCYGLNEQELEEFWRHRILLVADGYECLFGGAGLEPTNLAVRTAHPSLVEMALSPIVLDLTLLGHRRGQDPGPALMPILGDRLGRLDEMLERGPQ